jgi:hypothetical protein
MLVFIIFYLSDKKWEDIFGKFKKSVLNFFFNIESLEIFW